MRENTESQEDKPKEQSPPAEDLLLEEATPARGVSRLVTLLVPFTGLLLILIPFAIFAEGFLGLFNFKMVVLQTAVIAIAGTGMTFVIISGGIDLSVGSVIALATVGTALALKMQCAPWVAALCGIGVAALCGLLSGLLITGLRIVPFIATLGMWGIARGVAKLLAENQKIDAPRTWLNDLMARIPKAEWIELEPAWFQRIPEDTRVNIEMILLSPGLWIMLITVVVMWLVLRYTTFGRYTIAIGSNEPTARLCGVRVRWVKIRIYTLAGVLTGLAGLLQFSRLSVGDPTVAMGAELYVIAAVVIGGGSLSGGEGSIVGTLIGALAMAFLDNGCTLMEWPNYIQEIFIGFFIVVYVAIDQLRRARSAT